MLVNTRSSFKTILLQIITMYLRSYNYLDLGNMGSLVKLEVDVVLRALVALLLSLLKQHRRDKEHVRELDKHFLYNRRYLIIFSREIMSGIIIKGTPTNLEPGDERGRLVVDLGGHVLTHVLLGNLQRT